MAVRVPSSTPRADRQGAKGSNVQRLQLHRFQAWQRSTPRPTVALVRLVRLLAR